MKSTLRESKLMWPLECRTHFLTQAIVMSVGATLGEFIGSEEHHIGGTPDTGESQIESPMNKRWIHDRHLEESFVKPD
jgi:hypothetical protein